MKALRLSSSRAAPNACLVPLVSSHVQVPAFKPSLISVKGISGNGSELVDIVPGGDEEVPATIFLQAC